MASKVDVGKSIMKGIGSLGSVVLGQESVADLRKHADLARAQRDWARDAYYRRRICKLEPDRRGAWIQFGHALKEAGFYSKAAAAYERALSQKPGDADLVLQLAHLAKVRGNFSEADRRFEEAAALGSAYQDEIAFERKLLRRIDNQTIFWSAPKGEASPLRVFLSAAGAPVSESSKNAAAVGLGAADYSYSFAMRGFLQALEEMDIDHTVILAPEHVSDIRERSGAAVNIHLGFYPPERMRVLKGAYNINCFAWEFDRLRRPDEVGSHHAFADQTMMLGVADEIWIPSQHGVEAVGPMIDRPVSRVPAPVLYNRAERPRDAEPSERDIARAIRDLGAVIWEPLAILPRIQPTMDGAARAKGGSLQALLSLSGVDRPRLYLSVFNVHDYRKQIEPMISGFLRFAERDPRAILLLKMSTPHREKKIANRILLEEQIADAGRMVQAMVSDRVWITDAVLTRDELNRLYDASAYYVCTSYAEGQNLPLIEAMTRGVVPLSVDHTAMRDYISNNDAVVIRSEPRMLDVRLADRYRMYGVSTNWVTAEDVTSALQASTRLTREAYAHRSAASFEEAKVQFGLETFERRLRDVIGKLQAEVEA